MTKPFEPFWPKEELQSLSENPKRINLARPDDSAAELAENLQTAVTNGIFSRLALLLTRIASFIFVWILRPFVWLPIKFFGVALINMTATGLSRGKQRGVTSEFEERRRQEKLRGRVI